MSNLIYYRDNILSKVQENKELEQLRDWISSFDGEKIQLTRGGRFSKELLISKYTLGKLVEKQIEYNNEMVDKYLALSFKGEEKKNDTIGETK